MWFGNTDCTIPPHCLRFASVCWRETHWHSLSFPSVLTLRLGRFTEICVLKLVLTQPYKDELAWDWRSLQHPPPPPPAAIHTIRCLLNTHDEFLYNWLPAEVSWRVSVRIAVLPKSLGVSVHSCQTPEQQPGFCTCSVFAKSTRIGQMVFLCLKLRWFHPCLAGYTFMFH